MIAAGVGITPILSILLSTLESQPNRQIVFIQACLHEKNQAFASTLESLTREHTNLTTHFRYSESAPQGVVRSTAPHVSQGLVDSKLISELVGQANASYYFCGPKAFMGNLYSSLVKRGTPKSQIHFEFFGPRQEIENFAANNA